MSLSTFSLSPMDASSRIEVSRDGLLGEGRASNAHPISRPVWRAFDWLVPSAVVSSCVALALALDPATALDRGQTIPIATGVAAAILAVWVRWGRRRVIPRRFGVVEPNGLYRSGQLDRALVRRTLIAHEIGLIVNLTSEGFGDPDKDAERRVAGELGIERVSFHLDGDGLGDPGTYADALRTIVTARRAGRRVLIHCAAGSFRTGVAIALYRGLSAPTDMDALRRELRAFGVGVRKVERLVDYVQRNAATIRAQLGHDAIS